MYMMQHLLHIPQCFAVAYVCKLHTKFPMFKAMQSTNNRLPRVKFVQEAFQTPFQQKCQHLRVKLWHSVAFALL